MLFSSQPFILLFLPLALVCYYAAGVSRTPRLCVLLACSLVFYSWWDVRFVPLLVGTVTVNWGLSRLAQRPGRRWLLDVAIVGNLLLLGAFKYANFAAENVLGLAGIAFEPWTIILPLGISFFTFQQISYLIDVRRGEAGSYSLLEYGCFICFFPHLIAGPIVRHNELIPEFARHPLRDANVEMIGRGLALFILGFVKKVFFADELAPIADAGFALAAGAGAPGTAAAWQGALAYSLQLYFDFSAYSDMAMGLFGLFGFDLPLNFNRPYRATSIRDFWRRWHMTLSRFLRDYVYIPLGGNRHGAVRAYAAGLLTMLLCGLWHGAGWTFVAWGGLHGLAVIGNRLWVATGRHCPAVLGWVLTLLFVIVGWVLFRAENFQVAAHMLDAMGGHGGSGQADPENWTWVAVGSLFALLGPTNAELSQAPWLVRRTVALVLATLFVAALLRVGQGRGLEFIYFQF